jgi:hypothetical protein
MNKLEDVVSEIRKSKGSTRCPLFSQQRTLLREWLTEIWNSYEETVNRQLRQIQTKVTQEDSLSKKWSDTEPEDKSLVCVL